MPHRFCRKILSKTRIAINIATIFALVFYQLFLPFTLIQASADESPAQTTATSEPENSNSNDNKDNSNDNKEILGQAQDDTTEKTCEVKNSELTDYCQEKLDCDDIDKCLVKNSCGEIKKCLTVEIENKNETEVNNNVNSSSNTGENEIIQENSNENSNGNCNDNSEGFDNANDNGNLNANENTNSNENSNENTNSNENNNSSIDPSAPQGSAPSSAEAPAGGQDDNGGEAEIDTGDAVATSDVYNEVNTSIVSDNYQQTTINIEGTHDGDINLLEQFESVVANDTETETGSLTVHNENIAEVTNEIEVNANTGENSIETDGGNANIQTGDAVALSNTVNVVNTAIVGNNVLFAVVNVYGEWNGDLIVPGEGLLEVAPEPVYAETVIMNENEADVENEVLVEADTGNNAIDSEGNNNTADIISGAAYAGSEVVNIVNTSIVKNNFFFLMINNLGSWTGQISNWSEESGSYSNIFTYDFGVLDGGEAPTIDGLLAIFNKNSAKVENNVNVSANTGGNTIETEGDNAQALIETGNAWAQAKIINFINTNIIGNNWLFAVVNIMGKWNGDAVFAYPDLSVAISDGRDQVNPGENISYNVTYKNNGKAACDSTNILVSLPSYVTSGGNLNFSLAGLKPGEEKSFSISAVVSNDVPEGNTNLETLAGINTGTKEVELGNNMGKDETIAYRAPLVPASAGDNENPGNAFLGGVKEEKSNPSLTLTREVKDNRIHAGKTVTFNIFVENTGDVPLKDVIVFDEMKITAGTVGSFSWNLGDMKPGRKLRIQYKLAINVQAPSGSYRNTASGYGFDENDNKITANETSQKITVLGNETSNIVYNDYTDGQNLFQYGDSMITGGICFLDHWPAEDLINEANASGQDAFIAGANESNKPEFPIWMWLAAAAAYFLAINWSLFPKRKEIIGMLAGSAISEMVPAEVEEESYDPEYLEEEILEEEINENNGYKS